MNTLQATLELHVPAVLGGARARTCDPYFKLRPSAVRGGLRYWFRAAAAAVLWPDHAASPSEQRANDADMLETMRELESRIFGSTDRSSRVLVAPPEGGVIERWEPIPSPKRNPGLRYLGYGLFDSGRPPERISAGPGQGIGLELHLRDDAPEIRAAVAASLWLWASLGGLGARSRRGYGSMYLASLHGEASSDNAFAELCQLQASSQGHLEQLGRGVGMAQAAIEQLVRRLGIGEALLTNDAKRPHPHVRNLAGIANLHALQSTHDDPLEALEYAGDLFQRYRSSIKRSAPLPDYHHVKASLQPPFRPPKSVDRADFGMPLNFYYRSLGGTKASFVPQTPSGNKKSDRLASPLLFRVHGLRGADGKRRYGVSLINLAGKGNALLGCRIKHAKAKTGDAVEPSSLRLIDAFIQWAVEESKRARPRRQSNRANRRRRS